MKTSYLFIALLGLAACKDRASTDQTALSADNPEETGSVDLVKSLSDIETRILDDPDNAALYVERATAYIAHDSLANAISDFKRAIAIDSTKASYHEALGEVYYHQVRVEEARAQFRKALVADPNAHGSRLKLAEIELLLGNVQNTFDMVNEALRRDKYLAQGYYIKGITYAQIGDTTLAISSLQTVVEQDPKNYDGYMQLALIHERLGDPLAEDYYNTAIRLQPNSLEAHYGKAMYYQHNGQDSLALLVYDELKLLDPNFATAWYNAGFVHLEHLDDPKQAIKEFNQACRMQPMFSKAYFSKGLAHERLGELDMAGMSLQLALKIEPTNTVYANAMSRLVDAGYQIKSMSR